MDSAEKERLEALYEARVDTQNLELDGYAERWEYLCDLVIEKGGELVIPPLLSEVRVETLIRRGQLFEPSEYGVMSVEGEPSHCHDNVAELWRRGVIEHVVTGYALSDDGLWRSHSWGVRSDGYLVETTVERVRYFGVVLSDAEAFEFASGLGA